MKLLSLKNCSHFVKKVLAIEYFFTSTFFIKSWPKSFSKYERYTTYFSKFKYFNLLFYIWDLGHLSIKIKILSLILHHLLLHHYYYKLNSKKYFIRFSKKQNLIKAVFSINFKNVDQSVFIINNFDKIS